MVKKLPTKAGDVDLIPGLGRSPGVRNGKSPVFLSEEFHGQRSLVSYCPQGGKELDATEHARIHPGVKLLGHMVSKRRVKKLA